MKVIHQIRKRKSGSNLFMYPTSHDIFPLDCTCEISKEIRESISLDQYKKIEECYKTSLNVIDHVLHVGNRLLLVTKPHYKFIQDCISRFKQFKDQIIFRFTITSLGNKLMREFEPKAPDFKERMECIDIALKNGFNVTISIEPFLDMNPIKLIEYLNLNFPGLSEIWLGAMSKVPKKRFTESQSRYLDNIYNRNNIMAIRKKITELNDPRIKIKHSFRRIEENPKRKDLQKEIAGPGYIFPGSENRQFPVKIEEGCIVYFEMIDDKKIIRFVDLPRNRR